MYEEALDRLTMPTPLSAPINYILVKLAARCNLDCSYCYWFRDADVMQRPPILTQEAQDAWLRRVEEQITTYELSKFSFLFHGGEPLLFGRKRFEFLLQQLSQITARTGCKFALAMTTNGYLLDSAWSELLVRHDVRVTISIDGPPQIHDPRRLTLNGGPSYERGIQAITNLRIAGVNPGLLAVCDPSSDPRLVVDHFVDVLGFRDFDILVPDATHEDAPKSIAQYYISLFDYIYGARSADRIRVRLFQSMLRGLLGRDTGIESIGIGPILTVTLLTDGSLEPLDVVRTAGTGFTRTKVNVFDHGLEAIKHDPLWQELYRAGTNLHRTCQLCPFLTACGGGHIGSRWSKSNRFDNPSVYCADYIRILEHIWEKVSDRILIRPKHDPH